MLYCRVERSLLLLFPDARHCDNPVLPRNISFVTLITQFAQLRMQKEGNIYAKTHLQKVNRKVCTVFFVSMANRFRTLTVKSQCMSEFVTIIRFARCMHGANIIRKSFDVFFLALALLLSAFLIERLST